MSSGNSVKKTNWSFTKSDIGGNSLLLLGVVILIFGNSPAAAGGCFVAGGLCAVADALYDAVALLRMYCEKASVISLNDISKKTIEPNKEN